MLYNIDIGDMNYIEDEFNGVRLLTEIPLGKKDPTFVYINMNNIITFQHWIKLMLDVLSKEYAGGPGDEVPELLAWAEMEIEFMIPGGYILIKEHNQPFNKLFGMTYDRLKELRGSYGNVQIVNYPTAGMALVKLENGNG